MRISELEAREDHRRISERTLERAWSREFGIPVSVQFDAAPDAPGQPWFEQRTLSAWFIDEPSLAVRRFLADGFRYTRVKHRAPAQWLLGTAMASPAGLRVGRRHVFTVSPSLPCARDLMVLPGNRRLRFFDFRTGLSRVVLKDGFDDAAMGVECLVRAGESHGPFPNILRTGDGWFEEAIVPGYPLSRCPPWLNAGGIEREALARLEHWAAPSLQENETGDYVRQLCDDIEVASFGRWTVPERTADALARMSRRVAVGASHGDCQPGNLLVDARGRNPLFIDWEYYGRRSRYYDRVVYALGVRWPERLARQLRRPQPLLAKIPRDQLRSAIGVALLEDLLWRLNSWRSGPQATASAPLPGELAPVGEVLETLCSGGGLP